MTADTALSDRPHYGKRAYPVAIVARKAHDIGYSITALQGVRRGIRCRKIERVQSTSRDSISSAPIREDSSPFVSASR